MTERQATILGRITAAGLLLLSLSLLYIVFVAPIVGGYGAALAKLEADRALLVRYQRIAASTDEIEQQAAAVRERQQTSGVFLEGRTDALAAAVLQNALGAAVDEAGGELRSVQSLPSEQENGLIRVRLRLQLVANIRSLKAFLYTVETGTPLLFVDDLKLRTRLERVSVEKDILEVTDDFLIDLSLSGYRLETAS